MRALRFTGLALAGIFAGALAIGQANATIVTYQLTSDHCTGGCLGGLTSLGTVTVNDAGGNLAFSVDMAGNSGIINTGFDGSFAFNLVNNNVVTYSAINATGGAAFTPVGGNPVGAQSLTQFDGFGTFEYAVIRTQQGGGALPRVTHIDFSIDAVANLTVADLQQTAFSGGSTFFVVDAISGTTGNTGLVDAGVGTVVPEPASLAIFGAALTGLGLIRRRRKNV